MASSNWCDNVTTSVSIAAPPSLVYSILTDFRSYPSWNPFIVSITASPASPTALAPGIALSIVLNTNHTGSGDPSTMAFKPTITWVQANSGFEWLGRLFLGGLFDGRHRFEMTTEAGGGSLFVHSEEFSGFVIWLGKVTGGEWYQSLMANTKVGFKRMNESLKLRAEQQYAEAGPASHQ